MCVCVCVCNKLILIWEQQQQFPEISFEKVFCF